MFDCMCNELHSHVGGSLAGHVRRQETRDKSDPSEWARPGLRDPSSLAKLVYAYRWPVSFSAAVPNWILIACKTVMEMLL